MLKYRTVRLNVWEATIWIFWDCNPAQMGHFLKKNFKGIPQELTDLMIEDEKANFQGACYHKVGQSSQIIYLSSPPTTPHGASVLAHEAIHAIAHIMRHWSMLINYDTEEVLTSGVSCIMGEAGKKPLTK